MTLDAMVLQKIAERRTPVLGKQSLSVHDAESGWGACLAWEKHDDLGIAIWELQLLQTGSESAKIDSYLEGWAEAVSSVVGLLEPLQILEIDHYSHEALIRSRAPAERDGSIFYYEILLKSDREALIRRYRGAASHTRREQLPFILTHEALGKLVRDIIEGAPAPEGLS